jgi:hypothetical protein
MYCEVKLDDRHNYFKTILEDLKEDTLFSRFRFEAQKHIV